MSVSFNWSKGDEGSVGVLTLLLNGGVRNVSENHRNFKKVRDNLNTATADELLALIDMPVQTVEPVSPSLSDVTMGHVVVDAAAGTVCYNGEHVEQCLADKIAELQSDGLPIDGMVEFIKRIYNQMSMRTRTELLSFIDRNGLVIDSEGCFLAYKAVRNNYLDKYSGTIDNSPGQVVQMDRSKVDDNYQRGCSKGLHCGALAYISWYGGGDDRIVIVKVDPADVVSVPSDSSCQKIRTCKYTVVGDYEGQLKSTVYDADASTSDMYDADDAFYGRADDEDDDFDWSEVDDLDGDDLDDEWDEGDVSSSPIIGVVIIAGDLDEDPSDEDKSSIVADGGTYGTKPSGTKYHNKRDGFGRFSQ